MSICELTGSQMTIFTFSSVRVHDKLHWEEFGMTESSCNMTAL